MARGGSGSYTYTIGQLPEDLSLSYAHGAPHVAGTPAAEGTYDLFWKVEDSDGAEVSHDFTITVNAPLTLDEIGDRTFPINELIPSFTLPAATGGSGDYTYTLEEENLPAELTFDDSTMTVSGVPVVLDTYTAAWQVTDNSDGSMVSQDLTIEIVPTGALNCLPESSTPPTSLDEKLEILNCITFTPPVSWWQNELNTDYLKDLIDSDFTWLGGTYDECTKSPDLIVPGCRRHDIAYASLQKFEGSDSNSVQDKAWNGRNKYLADFQFHQYATEEECEEDFFWDAWLDLLHAHSPIAIAEDSFRIALYLLCAPDVTKQEIADMYFDGVVVFGIPITMADADHALSNPLFIACDLPSAPSNFTFDLSAERISWQIDPGCTEGNLAQRLTLLEYLEGHFHLITPGPSPQSTPSVFLFNNEEQVGFASTPPPFEGLKTATIRFNTSRTDHINFLQSLEL